MTDRVRHLLDQLQRSADVVVVDTASLTTGTEVEPLALSVDRVLLVIRAGRTRKEMAQRGRDVLLERGADVFGAIFNPHIEILPKAGKKPGRRSSK
jgi:Mrp family chromosome partitioning ATPase